MSTETLVECPFCGRLDCDDALSHTGEPSKREPAPQGKVYEKTGCSVWAWGTS